MKPMNKRRKIIWESTLLFLLIILSGCSEPSNEKLESNPPVNPTPTPLSEQTPVAIVLSTTTSPLTGDAGFGKLEKIIPENASRLSNLAVIGEGDFGYEIAVSPDGKLLAVASQGGVILYEADSGVRHDFFSTLTHEITLDFSPDGNYLAEVHTTPNGKVYPEQTFIAGMEMVDMVLTLWNVTTGVPEFTQNLSGRGCGDDYADNLEFSTDGQYLIFRDYSSLRGYGRSDNLCVISSTDGSLAKTIPIILPWESSSRAVFSVDGKSVLVGVFDTNSEESASRIQRYEIASGNMIQEIWVRGTVQDLALSLDGKVLAVADKQGASVFSASNGELIMTITSDQKDIRSIDLSPNGNRLLLGSEDGHVSLWELPSGTLFWENSTVPNFLWPGSSDEIPMRAWDVALSAEGNRLFMLSQNSALNIDNFVQAFQVSDGQELFTIFGRNSLGNAHLSSDASLAVFGGYEDGKMQLWSVANNEMIFELKGHTAMVLDAVFSPDDAQIASASADGTVKLWKTGNATLQSTLISHSGKVWLVAYSPDGTQLASIGDDATLRIWNTSDGTLLQSLPTQSGEWQLTGLTYAIDGASVMLAYRGANWELSAGGLYQIDLQTGLRETLLGYSINDISYSADQSMVGVEGSMGFQSGNLLTQDFKLYSSPMGNGALQGAAISPDGSLFFSGNGYGLHMWNAVNGELIAVLTGINPLGRISVSLNQRMIIVASWDGLIRVWGIRTGQ